MSSPRVSSPLVSVIVPTMTGRRWLPDCMDALRAQKFCDFEIIIVDNASRDGSLEWLAEQPDLRVIRNESNIGFAAAVNQGIRASNAPFVAVLNDDTRVSPRWLEALAQAMTTDDGRRTTDAHDQSSIVNRQSSVGSCASQMVFADRPDVVQSAGIAMDRAAIAWDRLGGRPVSAAQEACDIFGASAGAALYRREMLDQVGLFDERFFIYLEDVDLAWRAQRAGWRCRYVPQAVVLHATSATTIEGSPFKNHLIGRNKVWLAAKNARWQDLPVIGLYDLAAVIGAGLMRGNWQHLRGRVDGLRNLRAMLAERNGAQNAPTRFDPLEVPWQVLQRFRHVSR